MPGMLKIREGTLKDSDPFDRLFGQVEKLHRENLPSRFVEPSSEYPKAQLAEILSNGQSRLFIAESGQDVVGLIVLQIKQYPPIPIVKPGRFVSIEQLVVDEGYRGRGIGKLLMNHAEIFAKSEGISELELNVWNFNGSARLFYERLGFMPLRTQFARRLDS